MFSRKFSSPASSAVFILVLICLLQFSDVTLGSSCEPGHHHSSSSKRSAKSHTTKLGCKVKNEKFKKYQKSTLKRIKVHKKNVQHHKQESSKKSDSCKKKTDCDSKAKESKYTSKAKSHDDLVGSENKLVSKASSTKGLSSLLSVTSECGSANPTNEITQSSGPNGRQEFFNCGITSSSGWKPADVKMSMIKSASLGVEPAKSTFSSCQKYFPLFEKYGQKHNVPPIFLAAFAMQESSCNPHVNGDNGGAFGLMQITKDKCGGAPGGNCADPDYNVMMGAKTFADGLSSSNGNVLLALGAYNGWEKGLTKSKALQAKAQGCCECQQNLDYLQQFLNGWILGVDPYVKHLGVMRNLDSCQ